MPSILTGRSWLGEAGSNRGSGTGSIGWQVVSGCIVCVLVFFPFPFSFYYIIAIIIIIIIIIIILIIKLFLSQPTSLGFFLCFFSPECLPHPTGLGGVSEWLRGV